MRARKVWDKLFPLRIGDRVKIKARKDIAQEYIGRKGTIVEIVPFPDNKWARMELDHIPMKQKYFPRQKRYKFIAILLEDLERVEK